jgi:3-oxoacyl-[acyl-carrier protein] reductase
MHAVWTLNTLAPTLLAQAVLPHLAKPGGRIVNVSSVGARAGFVGTSAYASSKAAVEALTRVWARELGDGGVTVNAIAPGPVQSEMLDLVEKSIVEGQMKDTPVEKRVGRAEEIADAVAFLVDQKASWVSGQTISLSGGWAMY